MYGANINPNDKSGITFLNKLMKNDFMPLLYYLWHARNGLKYDFKEAGRFDAYESRSFKANKKEGPTTQAA